MLEALTRSWIHEAVRVYRTSASVSVCEDLQALEAEAGIAIAAHHLVALRFLALLLLEILLAHSYAASWALPCAGLLHPPHHGRRRLLCCLLLLGELAVSLAVGLFQSLGVLLASKILVVRLGAAS
jgi:hypothetical protein